MVRAHTPGSKPRSKPSRCKPFPCPALPYHPLSPSGGRAELQCRQMHLCHQHPAAVAPKDTTVTLLEYLKEAEFCCDLGLKRRENVKLVTHLQQYSDQPFCIYSFGNSGETRCESRLKQISPRLADASFSDKLCEVLSSQNSMQENSRSLLLGGSNVSQQRLQAAAPLQQLHVSPTAWTEQGTRPDISWGTVQILFRCRKFSEKQGYLTILGQGLNTNQKKERGDFAHLSMSLLLSAMFHHRQYKSLVSLPRVISLLKIDLWGSQFHSCTALDLHKPNGLCCSTVQGCAVDQSVLQPEVHSRSPPDPTSTKCNLNSHQNNQTIQSEYIQRLRYTLQRS